MKIKKAKILSLSVIWLVIVTMMVFTANSIFNRHIHKLQNGSIIAHSHPYNKSQPTAPYQPHKHTKIEIVLFQSADAWFFCFTSLSLILSILLRELLFYNKTEEYRFITIQHFRNRAPPFSL